MIMIEVLMLVEVLMRAGKVAYGAEHDNEGIGIVKMLNLGQERLQDICLVLANAGEQGQVETHLVILVEIVFNSIIRLTVFSSMSFSTEATSPAAIPLAKAVLMMLFFDTFLKTLRMESTMMLTCLKVNLIQL